MWMVRGADPRFFAHGRGQRTNWFVRESTYGASLFWRIPAE